MYKEQGSTVAADLLMCAASGCEMELATLYQQIAKEGVAAQHHAFFVTRMRVPRQATARG